MFHIMCIPDIHYICMHTGSLEGVTLVEFEPIEGEIPQEEPEEGGQAPDLP
jgi:hypothetical protein